MMIVAILCLNPCRHQIAQARPPAGFCLGLLIVLGLLGVIPGARAQMDPPTVLTQPLSRTNIAGTSATFNMIAGGTEPIAYQWFFQETNFIAAATNASLALSNVQPSNAGSYSVVATNEFGSATSLVAILSIRVPPS